METKIVPGDIVIVTKSGYHASKHPWNLDENSRYAKGHLIEKDKKYTVQAVDYDFEYITGYVIKIDDLAYGNMGVKVVDSALDNALNIIYND